VCVIKKPQYRGGQGSNTRCSAIGRIVVVRRATNDESTVHHTGESDLPAGSDHMQKLWRFVTKV
jgi:hypothetical protein